MSIFKKKNNEEAGVLTVVPSASFAQRLDNVKSAFITYYNRAVELQNDIDAEINSINDRLKELNEVSANTSKFIDNIKGLV